MAGKMENDGSPGRPDLKGTPDNPARDPKKMTSADKSEVGYVAFKDCVVIIGVAWLIVGFFYFSLRHFNI